MARSTSAFFRLLLAVLLCSAVLGHAAPGLAAPAAQEATPTGEAADEAGLAGTPAPTATEIPAGVATLTAVDTGRFPELTAYLLVQDLNGARVGALTHNAITLSENGTPIRGLTVSEADVGVQVVFVIDANDAFSARDANGINRLEHVKTALKQFATEAPRLKPGLDIVTILAAEPADQTLLERTDNPALIATALDRYESTFGGAADPFPLLQQALDYALGAAPRPGMRRYIVYFSSGWNRFDIEGGVADVAARANAAGGVPIFPVFVGPIGADNTLGAQNLARLAEATGGERVIFSGPESLQPLFQLLSDRGRQYTLTYRSTLDTTGQHRVAAQVTLPGGAPVASNEAVFPLRVEAPLVSLAGVPASVVRVAASHDADLATADPTVLEVPLVVDFPDGHPRGLRLAQLLVDGQAVLTQTNVSTLDSLAWPLAGHVEAGDHQLQARVIDELGLAAESAPALVSVSVQRPAAPPAPPLMEQVNDNWPLAAVALSGLLLAVGIGVGAWWWLARRQRLAAEAEAAALEAALAAQSRVKVRKVTRSPKTNGAAPAAGAAPVEGAAAPEPKPAARLSLPHVSLPTFRWGSRPNLMAPRGLCYFQVVDSGAGAHAGPRPDIDLAAPHLTLGRDAAVADTVFHDRSVSALHARVVVSDGRVTIVDQGSTAGTWVNYTPVPDDGGCELRHGDLVNLGRVQLRFLRRDTPPANGNGARVTPAPAATHSPTAGNGLAGPHHKAGA